MRLRYLYVSMFHWIASMFVSSMLAIYVLSGVTGYALGSVMWIVNFLLSFGFAKWAFHDQMPTPRATMWFIITWFTVTFSLQAAFEIFQLGQIFFLIHDRFLHVQYFLDLAAILLASYLTRRWKVKAVLSEGMVD